MGLKCCRGVDPAVDEDEVLKFFDHEGNECRWDDAQREVRLYSQSNVFKS